MGGCDARDIDNLFFSAKPDDDHPLGVPPRAPDLMDACADDLPAIGDHDQLVLGLHKREADKLAISLGAIHGDDALAGAALDAMLGDGRALSIAVFADGKHLLFLGIGDDPDADEAIAFAKVDSLYSSSAPPHRAEIVEREANAHSLCRSEHDLVVIPNDACIEELIAIIEPDRHDARLSDVGISIEERALHLAAL